MENNQEKEDPWSCKIRFCCGREDILYTTTRLRIVRRSKDIHSLLTYLNDRSSRTVSQLCHRVEGSTFSCKVLLSDEGLISLTQVSLGADILD
jgi:hypothetical protein